MRKQVSNDSDNMGGLGRMGKVRAANLRWRCGSSVKLFLISS